MMLNTIVRLSTNITSIFGVPNGTILTTKKSKKKSAVLEVFDLDLISFPYNDLF